MTDISPLALLINKGISRLWMAFLRLAVQLPFTLPAVTLGGCTVRQVVTVYLTVFPFVVLVTGLGLLCSVVLPRSGSAAWATGLVIVLILISPPLTETAVDELIARG